MSDLREALLSVDGTAPSIQRAAGAMMRRYGDRSTCDVAVLEWRNALQSSTDADQLLPLLYVANEVLQNSKRNRGNKFLEAFSPILKQSLVHVCRTDPSLVEKVRRTVKIWGDRRVFSVRYVNELLGDLEPYRDGGKLSKKATAATQPLRRPDDPEFGGASFSPPASPRTADDGGGGGATSRPAAAAPQQQKKQQRQHEKEEDRSEDTNNNDSDDDIMAILDDHSGGENDDGNVDNDEEDDDEPLFGSESQGEKLVLDFNVESTIDQGGKRNGNGAAASTKSSSSRTTSSAKRRRSSTGSAGSAGGGGPSASSKRRKSVLSTSNFVDVWNRLVALQQNYAYSEQILASIDKNIADVPGDALQDFVGDELAHAARLNQKQADQVNEERSNLYEVAQERHRLEQEAVRYVHWLEQALKQDDDDVRFCDALQARIESFRKIHPAIRKARDVRVADERKRQREREELEKKKREEEENEKFRKAALAKETEAKPGMVWNPSTREYQSLDLNESWRD